MKEVITLKEYFPHIGFGIYSAIGEDGSHFLIDMHIDGSTEPFVSLSDDVETSVEDGHAICQSLVGRQFSIEGRSPAMYFARKGTLL